YDNFLKAIIHVGTIASLFTFILIAFPDINLFVKQNVVASDDTTVFAYARNFGISEGLTFAYGTVQGLIFAITLYYARVNWTYYLLVPFLFLSILFNARIGFVPVIFAIFFFYV